MQNLQVPKTLENNKYSYIKDISYGAHSKVCLYENKALNIQVAVKIFKENSFFQFQNEKKNLLDLQKKKKDQNLLIPDIYFNDRYTCKNDNQENLSYLVLEYLPLSLDEFYDTKVKDKNVLNVDKLHKMGTDIITLIQKLHKINYIHKDIKPDNYRVKEYQGGFQIYLIDFGSSKADQILVLDSDQYEINEGTNATSSIFTNNNKASLQGDDLISSLYTILILVEPENVSWLEICKENIKKHEVISQKSSLNEDQFKNIFCKRIVIMIKSLENIRITNLQKYQLSLDYDEIKSFIIIGIDTPNFRQKQSQRPNICCLILYFLFCCCICLKMFSCCMKKQNDGFEEEEDDEANFNRKNQQQIKNHLIEKSE